MRVADRFSLRKAVCLISIFTPLFARCMGQMRSGLPTVRRIDCADAETACTWLIAHIHYQHTNRKQTVNRAKANAIIATAYNLHFGKQANKVMTPAEAAKLPRGDRAALCRVLEQKGGSDLYTADDARAAFALVVG